MVVTLVLPWPRGLQVCGVSARGHRSFRSAPRPSPDPGTASCAFCPAPSSLSLSEHGMLAANKVSNLLAVAFLLGWVPGWGAGGGGAHPTAGSVWATSCRGGWTRSALPTVRVPPKTPGGEATARPEPVTVLLPDWRAAGPGLGPVPPLGPQEAVGSASRPSAAPAGMALAQSWAPHRPAPRVPASLHQGYQMGRSEARRWVSQPWPPQPLTGPGLEMSPGFGVGSPGLLQAAAGQAPPGATPQPQPRAPPYCVLSTGALGPAAPFVACLVFGH